MSVAGVGDQAVERKAWRCRAATDLVGQLCHAEDENRGEQGRADGPGDLAETQRAEGHPHPTDSRLKAGP